MENLYIDSQDLVNHIRAKISKSETYFEDFYTLTDEAIERIMTTTFVFISTRIGKCFYCKHYRRLGFSQCKIKNHLQDDCFYHDLDKYRIAKKNYLNIMILVHESAISEGKRIDFKIPKEIEKKIIFESVRLFELIGIENSMKGDRYDHN